MRHDALDALDALARLKPSTGAEPAAPLRGEALRALGERLGHGWALADDGHHLEKSFAFPDFASALAFVNRVGAIAEAQGHHPDLHLAWGKVGARVWTHSIDGLAEGDFILAARIEQAFAA